MKGWTTGYDLADFSTTGRTPTTNFNQLRRLVLYDIVKWCLSVASKYCHICLEPLWKPEHLSSLEVIQHRMTELDFDHCVPKPKDANYTTPKMWVQQPLVVLMTNEKKSGCFCHKKCHYRGDNMKG